MASYSYMPKSLSRRVGRLFGAALNWFPDEASGTNIQRGRASSLFLRHLDFLIARDLSTVAQSKEASLGITIKKKVQHRINLLEQGDWLAAVAEALADAQIARLEAARRRTDAAIEDPQVLQDKGFETCISKVMGGSVRAGHRVIKSSGIHQACLETGALMASKFVTCEEGSTMADRPDLRQRARLAKAP